MGGNGGHEGELGAFGGGPGRADQERGCEIAGRRFPGAATAAAARGLSFGDDPDRLLVAGGGDPAGFLIRGIDDLEGFQRIAFGPCGAHGINDLAATDAALTIGAAPTTNSSVKTLESTSTVPRLGPIARSKAGAGSSK